jgi:hypothetical protein
MTNRTHLTVLCLLLVAAPLIGCSTQDSQAPASATATQAQPVAAAAQASPAVPGLSAAARQGGARQMAADYKQQCAGQATPSRDCEILRGLTVADVIIALEMMERSNDQRGTAPALAAFDFVGEPAIVVAAARVLGRFPDTPGLAAKVQPLMKSRFLEVQRMAAELLKAAPDAGLGEVGGLWLQNHASLSGKTDYDEYPDFPAHYASLGFPKYPKAEWFSPADTDRSIGWSTTESAEAVTRWFSDALKNPAIGVERWLAERTAAVTLFDQSTMTRMQQLMEKAIKGDAAARAEIERLQKELDAQSQNVERASKQSVAEILPPSASMAAARWIVAQRKDGRISRVVLVYPLQGLKRTVIQLAWDLSDYPSAWPSSTQ